MTAPTGNKYNVGGVLLDRPFKIRRLGHFGFNGTDMAANRHFYVDLLGLRVSADAQNGGFFGRHNGDHHSFVIFDREWIDGRQLASPWAHHYKTENDINQITWQVQNVDEVWQATKYFKDMELDVRTEGRASAGVGSNFHLYVWDPDDQIIEIFTGMEQIGWDGYSKPREMGHGIPKALMEPYMSEHDEVQEDIAKGIDLHSGYRFVDPNAKKYGVDGLLLTRPFKIIRVGPLNLFVDDVATTAEYYRDVLGLSITEEVTWQGERCVFLRADSEHHSLGLYPKALRSRLGLSEKTSNMSFGMQLANYRQLRDAVDFLRDNGVRVETDLIPPELHPGVDYTAYAFDPDGHCIELYYYMEQIGWDGRPRPPELRPKIDSKHWPETVEGRSDSFGGEPYLGPWG